MIITQTSLNCMTESTTTNNEVKIQLFRDLIHKYTPDASQLFEIGCGTGNVLQAFRNDYEITGLDLSANMLKIAAQKVPSARLIEGNMIAFDLQEKFDIILCVYDSINHLLKFSDWERVLANVAAHLRPKGLFIFDVNTFAKLRRRSAEPPVIHGDGRRYVRARMKHEHSSVFAWYIDIRLRDENANISK